MPKRFQTTEYDGDPCIIDIEKLSISYVDHETPFAVFSTREALAEFLDLASPADLERLREIEIESRRLHRERHRIE
jgi:hypothetical protein